MLFGCKVLPKFRHTRFAHLSNKFTARRRCCKSNIFLKNIDSQFFCTTNCQLFSDEVVKTGSSFSSASYRFLFGNVILWNIALSLLFFTASFVSFACTKCTFALECAQQASICTICFNQPVGVSFFSSCSTASQSHSQPHSAAIKFALEKPA